MLFILRRTAVKLLRAILTLILITAVLYAMVMLTPPQTRAELYMPKRTSPRMTEEQYQKLIDDIIIKYQLNDPFPAQYFRWAVNLVKGNWGYSPILQEDVFTAINRRAPATLELTFYTLLIFVPLGLISGVISGSKKSRLPDRVFRMTAFAASSLTPMILAIIMLVVFYIILHWFIPGRLNTDVEMLVSSQQFTHFTGLLTLDGLLNGAPQVSLDALRHLAMPALTLALAQWAVLGRVARATVIEELQKDYIVAARARGLKERTLNWRYALGNALSPVLAHTVLSTTGLMTGVFVVEIIFNYPGISVVAQQSMVYIPDAPAAMGFAIYSVLVVLALTLILDLIQTVVDPRMRERF